MILNKTRANNLLAHEIEILQIHEEIKENTLWRKIILKGNTTIRYTEYKHKNTGASCTSVRTSCLQCFNSFPRCWKTVSLKPSFELSAEIWSRFSRLVCFNWKRNKVFTNFILGKNLWTWQTRRTYAWKEYFMKSNSIEVDSI